MGLNFEVACHVHRVSRYIMRGHESEGLHTFYSEHESCLRNYGWEAVRVYPTGWTGEPPEGVIDGYEEDTWPPESEATPLASPAAAPHPRRTE